MVTLATTSVMGRVAIAARYRRVPRLAEPRCLVIENVLADDQPGARGHILDVLILTTTGGRSGPSHREPFHICDSSIQFRQFHPSFA